MDELPDLRAGESLAQSEQYQSWQQTAGYFDGDGNVGIEVVKYVLRIKLRFCDMWKDQIVTVCNFLSGKQVRTRQVSKERHDAKKDAYRIDVGAVDSMLLAAKAMLPLCSKEAEDLRIVIDYLEGRITGNGAIERFNREVLVGRRSGYLRKPILPYTRAEGLRLAQLENAKRARAAHAVNVRDDIQQSIKTDHEHLTLGHIRLSKKYGYSVSVIGRIPGTR